MIGPRPEPEPEHFEVTPMVVDARAFAREKHAGQMYGRHPYMWHVEAVVANVRRFGFAYGPNRDLRLIVAYLHDVHEDTGTPIEEIRARFGDDVARLVHAVSNEPGENRKARALATYPKIRAAGRDAVIVKLCDRIANVEECRLRRDHRLRMYQKEHADFRAALFSEDDGPNVRALWDHLDQLMT